MTYKTCAVIFARGGSKRLVNKHLLDINGQPLLAYSIQIARQQCSYVYVSTNDNDIKVCAEDYGALVIHRPDEIAQDTSPIFEAVRHAYRQIKVLDWDYLVQLEGNTIYRTPNLLFNSILAFHHLPPERKYFLTSVIDCQKFHPDWVYSRDEFGMLKLDRAVAPPSNGNELTKNLTHLDGTIHIYTRNHLDFLSRSSYNGCLEGYGYPIDALDVVHVDTQSDIELARALCKPPSSKSSIIGYPK